MVDKLTEFRRFLQSSGLHETLQALDHETARGQASNQMAFTFERLPSLGPGPNNCFRPPQPQDDTAMKFDSPCAKRHPPRPADHRPKSLFNPQIGQPFRDDTFSDCRNNEDQFSFREDLSDNEEHTQNPDDYRRGGGALPSFAQSDNCIRVQLPPAPSARTPNIFQMADTAAFNTAPQSTTSPLHALPKPDPFSEVGSQNNLRPRSIQSRNNSAERDNSHSSFLQDRPLTPESPVLLLFSDACLLNRHRDLRVPAHPKRPTRRDAAPDAAAPLRVGPQPPARGRRLLEDHPPNAETGPENGDQDADVHNPGRGGQQAGHQGQVRGDPGAQGKHLFAPVSGGFRSAGTCRTTGWSASSASRTTRSSWTRPSRRSTS